MSNFSIGQKVDFKRNSFIFTNNTPVLVELDTIDKKKKYFIVENKYGWIPDIIRVKQYQLDPEKKYLFAHEHELSEHGSIKTADAQAKIKKKK